MNTVYIPNESDIRKWVKETMKECLEDFTGKVRTEGRPEEEPLLSRKEIAGVLGVSLVTLHEWMKGGLPCHKQGGRVYFLKSEVHEFLKSKPNPRRKTVKQ